MQGGSIRLFKIFGIEVFLHFSWFLVAAWQLSARRGLYASPIFALYEYLALFAIVLTHEFGHALACRQTGGTANRIMLWPLGGIAYVRPPERAGAQLWSIAAGPLVNVILIPVLVVAQIFGATLNWPVAAPDAYRLLVSISWINLIILCFNLLPIYPLDGGQILRSLLWFVLGRVKSLRVASVLGFITIPLLVVFGISQGFSALWGGILGFFLFSQAVAGWRQAQALATEEKELARFREMPEPPVVYPRG